MSKYDKLIDQIAKDLHSGKLKASDLNQPLISQTYDDISQGAREGYGKTWMKFPADGKGSTPLELKKNIYAFSGAKIYAELEAMNQLLYDKDGKLRPFNEFAVLAKKINRDYNQNYLQAEYQTARTAAQMAEKWERIIEDSDLFPNLKFRTVGDSRVRREHDKLDGIIRAVNDPFWSKYYPPLDWRCRCDVVQTAEDQNDFDENELPPVQFKGNVGKDKEIFTKKGTFFKLAAGSENAKRNIELSKLNAPYETAFKSKNGKVEVSIFHDTVDIQNNYLIAESIVENYKTNFYIRPHVNVQGIKNPEYFDGKLIGDLTVRNNNDLDKYVKNTFSSKYGKNGQLRNEDKSFLVMSLNNRKLTDNDLSSLARQLWSKMNYYKKCDYVIVENNRKTIKINRFQLREGFEKFKESIDDIKDKRAK